MLTGVFHLHEQEARQVMTPIPAVVTVDVSQDVQSALELCISSGHTRLVVIEGEDRDRVRGLVHASSLARRLMHDGPDASIEPIMHDAPIVPETKPLDDLLADLQRRRSSMAVVVDEYGRVVGIVTIEDIIEEVVGEIADETDSAAGEVRRLADGDLFVRGHVSIADLLDYGVAAADRQRRLQLGRRLRLRRAGPPAAPRRHDQLRRLLDPGGVGASQPRRGGAHPRAARAGATSGSPARPPEVAPASRRPPPETFSKHVRPAGGAGRSVCTGRRRECVCELASRHQDPRRDEAPPKSQSKSERNLIAPLSS